MNTCCCSGDSEGSNSAECAVVSLLLLLVVSTQKGFNRASVNSDNAESVMSMTLCKTSNNCVCYY
jgi:hypothetical protein